ncbi:MAG: hypothetical protein R3C17_21655 [Planctomycetaceae bacterium]
MVPGSMQIRIRGHRMSSPGDCRNLDVIVASDNEAHSLVRGKSPQSSLSHVFASVLVFVGRVMALPVLFSAAAFTSSKRPLWERCLLQRQQILSPSSETKTA